MKRSLILAALLTIGLFGCNKDDDNGGGTLVDYSGTYKGTITIQLNGNPSGTLADHSIVFTQNGNIMTLGNNVFDANTGKVSGSTFTLDKKVIASAPTYNTERTGTAVFSGGNAALSFKEQEVDTNTGAVLNTKTWTGTLIKQ